MLILTMRTDNPEAEIGLYEDDHELRSETWQAHRQLAETIHLKLTALLKSCQKEWHDIQGIVVYEGPGSFTGLRIGVSIANALSSSLQVSIVGAEAEDWTTQGIKLLLSGKNNKHVVPVYGSAPHITQQKK